MLGRLKTGIGLGVVIAILMMQGCVNKYTIKPGDSLETAFKKAMHFYAAHKYDEATQAFQTVLSLGRGTGFGKEAQYYMAESYYKNKEYLLAASEFKRYYTFYPNDQKKRQVQFMEAMCYYHLSPAYNLDQSYTNQAIELFQLFIADYPNSKLSTEAGKYIDHLRNKLAHKMFGAAALYMRNREYKAAAVYYGLTMDTYPDTKWAEVALADQINAYLQLANNSVPGKQKERYNKAVDSYEKFVQLFPKGKNRAQAENYYDQAKKALAKISKAETDTTTASVKSKSRSTK